MKKKIGRPPKFTPEERKARKLVFGRIWRENNPEKVKESEKKRLLKPKNKERIVRYLRVWNQRPEVKKANAARTAAWRAKDPEKAKKVSRESHIRNMYGLTLAERDTLFAEQNHCCAICGASETNHPKGWFVDHIHGTKIVRGILCNGCNSGIGFLKDDPVRCRAAADYLEKFRTHKL